MSALQTSVRELAAAGGTFQKFCQPRAPPRFIPFPDDDAGIANHVRDLSTIAAQYRYPASKSLDQHPAELFTPLRPRLTRGTKHIHDVKVSGHHLVVDVRANPNTVPVTSRPAAEAGLQGPGPNEQGAPGTLDTIQRAH